MEGDAPLLDRPTLDRLEDWGGAELRQKMIELFLTNAPERLDGIQTGLRDGDLELAERSAHSLKSSAANLGAEWLRALAGRIETLLESGDSEAATEVLPELEQSFTKTIDILRTVGGQEAS